MIKLYNFDELRPEEILNRDIRAEKNVEDVVDGIIADVRARGDEALKDYALKFDGAKIDALQVTQEERRSLCEHGPLLPRNAARSRRQHRELPPPAGAQEFCGERQARHRAGPEIYPH